MNNTRSGFVAIELATLEHVIGGNGSSDRPFDLNKDGTGRVVDHNNGQHVGGPPLNPLKTVDFVPAPLDPSRRN